MSDSDLDLLRHQIDEIDDNLQDLLVKRMGVVARVAGIKLRNGSVDSYQPAREAELLRRLVSRTNEFPPKTLVRMWRELLAATVLRQGPFKIAVYVTAEQQGCWDLARDQYGSHASMLPYGSTAQVIRAVTTEGQANIGVLPIPDEEEPDPWWRHLLSSDENSPRIIARLPFGGRGNARTDSDALAIGRGAQVPTGNDRTLIATENDPDISRSRMLRMLSGLQLDCSFMASCHNSGAANTLIELNGFVPVSDPRLQQLREQLGPALLRLMWFGGYAAPLTAAELAG